MMTDDQIIENANQVAEAVLDRRFPEAEESLRALLTSAGPAAAFAALAIMLDGLDTDDRSGFASYLCEVANEAPAPTPAA